MTICAEKWLLLLFIRATEYCWGRQKPIPNNKNKTKVLFWLTADCSDITIDEDYKMKYDADNKWKVRPTVDNSNFDI